MKRLEKGFTLIELMIVVAIIAILAAVAAPKFGSQIKKARDAKALSIVGNWRSGSQLYYADNEVYASDYGDLTTVVDKSTANVTFEGKNSTTVVTSTSSVLVGYIVAGTSQLAGSTTNEIEATYTTDGAISITNSGNNTQTKAWDSL